MGLSFWVKTIPTNISPCLSYQRVYIFFHRTRYRHICVAVLWLDDFRDIFTLKSRCHYNSWGNCTYHNVGNLEYKKIHFVYYFFYCSAILGSSSLLLRPVDIGLNYNKHTKAIYGAQSLSENHPHKHISLFVLSTVVHFCSSDEIQAYSCRCALTGRFLGHFYLKFSLS